jgi:hypothetical protein
MAKRKPKSKTAPKAGQLSKLNTDLLAQAELGMVQGMNPVVLGERLALAHDVTFRTVARYFRLIRERWASEEIDLRPARRAEFRAMVKANFALAYATDNASAGASTLRLLARLDGLEAPMEIKLTGSVDVRALSPMERKDEIERLLALRKKATKKALLNGKTNGKTRH